MRLIRLLTLASMVVGVISVTEVASAQQASRWPNLNPFKKTANPAASGPKLPFPKIPVPWSSAKSRPKRSSQPTAWQRFNQGSKNLWSKTASTLNPWSKPATPQRRSVTGTRRTYSGKTASNRSSASRKPFYASWLQPAKPESKPVESVNDWLRLPPVTLDDN